jgi:hypothetical protein
LAGPFNIKADSMILANFTEPQIKELYLQHTESTGQIFEDAALERVWHWSRGQPWLVNALARQVIEKELKDDFSVAVTPKMIDQAAEDLMKSGTPHLDSLVDRLKEPGVIKVLKPVFAGGESFRFSWTDDDVKFCEDLGLVVADESNMLHPANPLYAQMMARFISYDLQELFTNVPSNLWSDGDRILMTPLIEAFLRTWRKFGATFPSRLADNLAIKYDEATHAFMLFQSLQRVIDGSGATVEMQYAQGRGRVDICVVYKKNEYPMELKVKNEDRPFDEAESVAQLARCMESSGTLEGWLMVFDQNRLKNWDERYSWTAKKLDDLTIHVISC